MRKLCFFLINHIFKPDTHTIHLHVTNGKHRNVIALLSSKYIFHFVSFDKKRLYNQHINRVTVRINIPLHRQNLKYSIMNCNYLTIN